MSSLTDWTILSLINIHSAATPIPSDATTSSITFPYNDTLISGFPGLLDGPGLRSPNGRCTLVLQDDGNLVEYFFHGFPVKKFDTPWGEVATGGAISEPLWATDTYGRTTARARLEATCHSALYDGDGEATWAMAGQCSRMESWAWSMGCRMPVGDDEYFRLFQRVATIGRPSDFPVEDEA